MNMRKLMTMILLLTLSMGMQAQKTPAAKARVAQIRQTYAEAKKNMTKAEQLLKEGKPANMTVVNSSYTLGDGAGKAGNIVTAAATGLIAARDILKECK